MARTTGISLPIHVASESALKIEAVQLAFQEAMELHSVQVTAHSAPSGVNSQPYGYAETAKGASNRIASIVGSLSDTEKNFFVSIENGVRFSEEDKTYYDFVHVIVRQGDNSFSHTLDCCKIPAEIIQAIPRDKNNQFLTTWGEIAKKMGRASQADNPHQELEFGNVSRIEYIKKALSSAINQLKTKLDMEGNIMLEKKQFTVSRMLTVNNFVSGKKFAKRGVLFSRPTERRNVRPINLYNQGCPHQQWETPAHKVKRNDFKVFLTGDAFSILSPDVELKGANIHIHAGLQHDRYSPLVLLQEALQLCRCAYEHGAHEITITLPEQFHPLLHTSDFNLLLARLFKSSGANKIFYYNSQFTGVLDDSNRKEVMTLTLSDKADPAHYEINRNELFNYLTASEETRSDGQVMHAMRQSYLGRAWDKFSTDQSNLVTSLGDGYLSSNITVPENQDKSHVLLCCSANRPLAKKIAESLRNRGEKVKLYYVNGTGEQATIPDDAVLCGSEVTIIQSTRPNPDNFAESQDYNINGASAYFFEAAIIARQAHLRGASLINLINPYQYNARSDKAENNAKGKTGAYVQHNGMLLAAAGINHVITAECHDNHTMSGQYTGKNIRGSAVSALTVIASTIASEWLGSKDDGMHGQFRLVTPDAGATKRTKELTLELQAILGKSLCKSRILGEKQRATHQDDSALINSLNSGSVGINPEDKYVITDDETATGNTLCQAIINLRENGAKDISVIVVHNNMPLDWLTRQLCLARFLYIGVNDLHFSDTQEMGTLASSYEHLIENYSRMTGLCSEQILKQIQEWFKKNMNDYIPNKSDENLNQEFNRFTSMFALFKDKITVHSLADEFAKQVASVQCTVDESITSVNTNAYRSEAPALLFSQNTNGSAQSSLAMANTDTINQRLTG